MSIFDRFTGGDDIEEEQLADVRGSCNRIVTALRENHFSAEKREEIARAVRSAEETGAEVTTAELEAPVPSNAPASDTLADCLAGLAGGMVPEDLEEDATAADLERLEEALTACRMKVESADGFEYEYDEVDVDQRHGKPVIAEGLHDGREELYAGPYARQLMENAQQEPDQPLWLGLGTRDGRDAAVRKQFLFRHMGIFGVTGYGKSTLLKNSFYQLAAAGYGGCFIDPKGDDSKELMEILPEERMDDVIWIEPGSSREYISGFNFLDIGLSPDHPHYDTAVEALVKDLVKLLGAGNYWGPRMDRVAQNLIRAMHESQYDFTLIDMYYVLSDEESREQFADLVAEEGLDFVREYTDKIAEMDEDDLEPLLGRFQPWVENKLARRMVAFRDSAVNIPKAVENGKIIIVRMGAEDKDLKRMLGMAVVRRIWAAVRARSDVDEEDRNPFFLFADEFDNIALNDETIPTMLSEARSYRLSLTFCCQYPGQLPDDVVEGMLVNCDTIVSFNPGSKQQAKYVAPKLDIDQQDLLNEVNFHVWMRVTLNRTMEKSDAFRVYTYPPYPPVRTNGEASDLIDRSLERNGRPKKSHKELQDELLFNHGRGLLEGGEESQAAQLIDAMDGDGEESGGPRPGKAGSADGDETAMEAVLEGVFAARLQADLAPGEFVPVSDVRREVERRVGDTGYKSELSNVIERVPDEAMRREQRGGELHLALTDRGRTLVFDQDTGSSASGGGEDHRWVLREAYRAFSGLGYVTTLPTQEGEEVPDGVAEVPIDPAEGESIKEIERLREQLYEEYPRVWGLSGGSNVTIEAETSTPKKPTQPIVNMRKAVDRDDVCVFACRDGTAAEGDFAYWAKRIEKVLYHTEHTGRETIVDRDRFIMAKKVTEEGRQFYNKRTDYELEDDVFALRPTANSRKPVRWVDKGDRIVAEDNESGEFAVFDSVESVAAGDRTGVPAYYEYREADDEYVLYDDGQKEHYASEEEILDEWSRFKAPYVPENDFETPVEEVGEDDFVFVVFPDDDNDRYDGPQVYEDGHVVPLREYADPEVDALAAATDGTHTEASPGTPETVESGDGDGDDPGAAGADSGTGEGAAGRGAGTAAEEDSSDPQAPAASPPDPEPPEPGQLAPEGAADAEQAPPTTDASDSPETADGDPDKQPAGDGTAPAADADPEFEPDDDPLFLGGPDEDAAAGGTGDAGADDDASGDLAPEDPSAVVVADGGDDLGLAHGGLFEDGPDLSRADRTPHRHASDPVTAVLDEGSDDGLSGGRDGAAPADAGTGSAPAETAETDDTGGFSFGDADDADATSDRSQTAEDASAAVGGSDSEPAPEESTGTEGSDDGDDKEGGSDPEEEFFDAFGD